MEVVEDAATLDADAAERKITTAQTVFLIKVFAHTYEIMYSIIEKRQLLII